MLLHLSRASFGTRTNVFLSGKAEIAVETRHDCAVFFETQKRTADYPASASSATAGRRGWHGWSLGEGERFVGERFSQDSLCGQQVRPDGFGVWRIL